ncbi:MAG: NADPH-dependent F420 reductase [Alphaproteobacteria bacterium]|nr:NADPH-dependent F420 reductase [Alphaproteobacteria bacterium]
MNASLPTVAVIGGTGDLGSGLAWRWARAGYPVIVGSRVADRAAIAAAELKARTGKAVRGMENAAAATAADISVLTVPYANHQPTLETIKAALAGKILVDATVPLMPPKVSTVQLPPGGSVAVAAQAFLGQSVRVVSALQTVAAHKLQQDIIIQSDVLVAGDDAAAREAVIVLVAALGLKGWHAGVLANSVVAEAMTSVLIAINRRYKIDGAGLCITGEPTA